MPAWVWIAFPVLVASVGFLFLIRVRCRFDWDGGSQWSAALEIGVPGFMRGWHFPAAVPPVSEKDFTVPPREEKPIPKIPSPPPRRGSDRGRRALFLFVTDPAVLRALFLYGLRFMRRTFSLLNLELDCGVGYTDPAMLGRWAGYWHAIQPLLGTRRLRLQFRFQDQTPSLQLHLRGGFSAARALAYGFMALVSFPWLLLIRRAWRSAWHTQLSGWRAWVYHRMRAAL